MRLPLAPWPRRRETHRRRQVHGDAGGRGLSISKHQVPALHCAFLAQCFLCCAKIKGKIVAKMLKAIHTQEKKAAREKAKIVVADLKAMKLKEAARKVENGIYSTGTPP